MRVSELSDYVSHSKKDRLQAGDQVRHVTHAGRFGYTLVYVGIFDKKPIMALVDSHGMPWGKPVAIEIGQGTDLTRAQAKALLGNLAEWELD